MRNQMKLTKEDVSALRKADGVIFRYHAGVNRDGEHLIEAVAEDKDEFGYRDRRRTIQVDGSFTNYAIPSMHDTAGEPKTCFEYIHAARFDHSWPTVAEIIKAGDELRLHWMLNNNTET